MCQGQDDGYSWSEPDFPEVICQVCGAELRHGEAGVCVDCEFGGDAIKTPWPSLVREMKRRQKMTKEEAAKILDGSEYPLFFKNGFIGELMKSGLVVVTGSTPAFLASLPAFIFPGHHITSREYFGKALCQGPRNGSFARKEPT